MNKNETVLIFCDLQSIERMGLKEYQDNSPLAEQGTWSDVIVAGYHKEKTNSDNENLEKTLPANHINA